MPRIHGARYRGGAETGDLTGYGPVVYSGTASSGSPTSGTAGFGAGTINPGGAVISVAGKTQFVNTNTKASPTWTQIGSA
jgi:hypothetical protein